MRKFIVPLLLALTLTAAAHVRAQNVGGGLSLAGVASQIDGDRWGGYKKVGLHFGGYAWYDLSDRLSLMVELLYGYRGSREVVTAYGQISLGFIDVPVLLRYRILEQGDAFLLAEAGTSANILLSARAGFGALKADRTDDYSRYTMEAHAGATYFFNRNVGLFGRWSIGYFNLSRYYPPWFTIHYFSFGVKVGFR